MTEELLNLRQYQTIKIGWKTYTVWAMVKFTEGNSYWQEYVLRSTKGDNVYYLDVEPAGKVALHEMVQEKLVPDMFIQYGRKKYELFQKGTAKVDYYFGFSDVYQWEKVSYYEYLDVKKEKELFTIEVWHDTTECSIGRYIPIDKISIM